MTETRLIMGMPVTVQINDAQASMEILENVFEFFRQIDNKFSTYKPNSEISRINRGEISESQYSAETKEVFRLSAETKTKTNGFFNIWRKNYCDPSGLVKGWAIWRASELLRKAGMKNFYLDAGGDIQVAGKNPQGQDWLVGIKNPFNVTEIVKKIKVSDVGIATSGNYIRGNHIYDPHTDENISQIASLTVIGPNIYEADRFATAAFAMGAKGVEFIESLPGFEAYQIDKNGLAIFTSGFAKYVSI